MTPERLQLFCLIILVSFAIGVVCFLFGSSRNVQSKYLSPPTVQNEFLRKNCIDEKGHVLSNEDGLVQYRCIDRNAQIAQNGDPDALARLAETILQFGGLSTVPESVLQQFQDRLVRSELKYRAGDRPGITEENIVRSANSFMNKLHAPEYAKTYPEEVTLLRQESRSGMPHFVSPEGKPMSPLESVYILDLLVYQKIFNETFLLTPTERMAVEQRPAEKFSGSNVPPKVTIAPRVKEMMALARATGAMNVTDLIRMGHELLDDLQIDR